MPQNKQMEGKRNDLRPSDEGGQWKAESVGGGMLKIRHFPLGFELSGAGLNA